MAVTVAGPIATEEYLAGCWPFAAVGAVAAKQTPLEAAAIAAAGRPIAVGRAVAVK